MGEENADLDKEVNWLASSMEELETKLAEMATLNETLEAQHHDDVKKCRHMEADIIRMEVIASFHYFHDNA